ncbi:cytochrome P450 81E8-like protein [Tanacetum coccineum]
MVQVYYEEAERSLQGKGPKDEVVGNSSGTAHVKDPLGHEGMTVEIESALEGRSQGKGPKDEVVGNSSGTAHVKDPLGHEGITVEIESAPERRSQVTCHQNIGLPFWSFLDRNPMDTNLHEEEAAYLIAFIEAKVDEEQESEECFTNNDIVFANRPSMLFRKIVRKNNRTLVWAPYSGHWRNLRRIVSIEILSIHRLNELHDTRADEIKLLILNGVEKKLIALREKREVFFQELIEQVRKLVKGDQVQNEKKTMIEVLSSLQKLDPDYYTDEMIRDFVLASAIINQ